MTRLLFVCIENSCRCQMAEAFARLHGKETVEASSAGSRPLGRVNPNAIGSMKELGCDLAAHVSKSLDEISPGEYDLVVTMGCGDVCPIVRARHREEWNIPDPKALPPDQFRIVRDEIEKKVKEVLARLERESRVAWQGEPVS